MNELQATLDMLHDIANTAERVARASGLRDEQITFKLGFVLGMIEGNTPGDMETIIPTILVSLGQGNIS
jgi:hypothetical protein